MFTVHQLVFQCGKDFFFRYGTGYLEGQGALVSRFRKGITRVTGLLTQLLKVMGLGGPEREFGARQPDAPPVALSFVLK